MKVCICMHHMQCVERSKYDLEQPQWIFFKNCNVFVIIKFFKSYHKTYWKIILFCVIFVIFNMTKITQNRWYAKSPSVPFVARQRTLTSIASKICMSHIIIWNLFLLHTSEDFLSTYYSNLTFLKAAKSGGKDSHDFNTEGFSKTFKFIWDHF